MLRRVLSLASLSGLAFGALVLAAGSPEAQTVGATQTQEFGCTGAPVSWVVPANVSSITVEAWGAQGGRGDNREGDHVPALAGLGGHTKATIAVTPGETLQVAVGCQGHDSSGGGTAGGFGGSPGGNGGIGGDAGGGGSGGGSSDVRQGGTASTNRVVVAGGGGGSAGIPNEPAVPVGQVACAVVIVPNDGHGGDGGGTDAEPGGGSDPCFNEVTGGTGGTQTANGTGGTNVSCTATFKAGQDGTEAAGGNGGSQPTYGAGGGGGGGYKGGGGGAGCVEGSGGGGGSGFAVASATAVVQEVGVQTGDGRIVITYTPIIPAAQPAFTG